MDVQCELQAQDSVKSPDTDRVMEEESRASAFKEVWISLRDQRSEYVTQVQDALNAIKTLCEASSALLNYFYEQACSINPDYAGKDPLQLAIAASTGQYSQLGSIWANYSSNYASYQAQAVEQNKKITDTAKLIAGIDAQVATLKSDYEKFYASSAGSVKLPAKNDYNSATNGANPPRALLASPAQLQADVESGDSFAKAAPANTIVADASILNDLSTSANAILVNDTVEYSPNTALSSVQVLPAGVSQKKLTPMQLGLGIAALFYIFKR